MAVRRPLLQSTGITALFSLSAGVALRIEVDTSKGWGTAAIRSTGNKEHLEKLRAVTGLSSLTELTKVLAR
jgi:hypothetical protein